MTRQDRDDRLADELMAKMVGCPEAERLRAFQDGTLAAENRDATADHVEGCRACSAALEFLRSEAAEPRDEDLPGAVERRSEELVDAVRVKAGKSDARTWEGVLRVAAMIVFAAALGVFAWQWLGPEGPEDDLGEYRGGEPLELLDPEGRLEEPPESMHWVPAPDAKSYRVVLLDETMNEVWTGRTDDAGSRLALDEEAMALLTPGARYTWQVEALDAVGAVIDRSAAAHFEIAGEPPR